MGLASVEFFGFLPVGHDDLGSIWRHVKHATNRMSEVEETLFLLTLTLPWQQPEREVRPVSSPETNFDSLGYRFLFQFSTSNHFFIRILSVLP